MKRYGTLSYSIMSDQVSPLNTAAVSKCSKYRLRKIKVAKVPGGAYPLTSLPPPPFLPPLEAHTYGSSVIAVGLKSTPYFPPKVVGISVGFNFEFRTWSVLSWAFLHGFTVPFMFPSINRLSVLIGHY